MEEARGIKRARGGKKVEGPGKPTRKVTAAYLERAALHYLGRFSSSEHNLRTVLERKVRRRNESHAAPSEEQISWINDVVAKCIRYGYLDDQKYAAQRSEQLLLKGKPARMIRQDLKHKGISDEIAAAAMAVLKGDDDIDMDRRAAAAFIRRRRFGRFRRPPESPEQEELKLQKELASMARAGFGYGLSREILDLSMDDINDLLG